MVQIEVVVAIDACPIHVCTVTGSTLRASQRQAAVCRKSWMRRPCAMEAQASVGLNAEACSRCPEEVPQRRSSAVFVSPRSGTGAIAGQGCRCVNGWGCAQAIVRPAKTAGG
jgi:hypothetical protein